MRQLASAFEPACIAQLIQVELFRRRLHLVQIQGASLSNSQFSNHVRYKFEQENKATLTIYLRPENNESETLSLPYQTIQFLKNSDYFRIDAPDKEGPYIWDYYRSARAYDKVKEILEGASASHSGGQ